MRQHLLPALLILASLWLEVHADSEKGKLFFPLNAPPELARYSQLFEKPAILALALENAGVPYKLRSRLKIKSEKELVIQSPNYDVTVKFVNHEGESYAYDVSISGGVTLGQSLTLCALANLSHLKDGTLTANIRLPLGDVWPDFLTEPIRVKAQLAMNTGAPDQLLKYLQGLGVPPGDALAPTILADAYSRGTPGGGLAPEPGDIGPFSDRMLALFTLALWGAGVPLLILTAFRLRCRGAAPVPGRDRA